MKAFKTIALASVLVCLTACGSSKQATAPTVEQTDSVISGVVYDEDGAPLYGAMVHVVGQRQQFVQTDYNGNFTLKIPGKCKIEVTYIGCKNKVVKVKPGQNIAIYLDYDLNLL